MTEQDKWEKEAEKHVPQDWLEGETRQNPKKRVKVKKMKKP